MVQCQFFNKILTDYHIVIAKGNPEQFSALMSFSMRNVFFFLEHADLRIIAIIEEERGVRRKRFAISLQSFFSNTQEICVSLQSFFSNTQEICVSLQSFFSNMQKKEVGHSLEANQDKRMWQQQFDYYKGCKKKEVCLFTI